MRNRRLPIVLLVMSCALLLGSTLSWFSDRADISAQGTAGSVKIQLNPDVAVMEGEGTLIPGDGRQVNFEIPNKGNKSIDLKETIKLTCSVPMTNTARQAEFDLYKTTDVEQDASGAFFPKSFTTVAAAETDLGEHGYLTITDETRKMYKAYADNEMSDPPAIYVAKPLGVRSVSADSKTITYTIAGSVLDGDHSLPEFETEPEADGKDTELEEYTLIFRKDSTNEFKDGSLVIEKLVLAKQHRNTGAEWNTVASGTYEFQNGDVSDDVESAPS